jgi:hypothetical protein
MVPVFKLQVLLLAKMQWDVRQHPDQVPSYNPWPAKALARAVRQMVSPCVAGELLQQRAPGLLPFSRPCRRLLQAPRGQRWEVEQFRLPLVSPVHLGQNLQNVSHGLKAALADGAKFDVIGRHAWKRGVPVLLVLMLALLPAKLCI